MELRQGNRSRKARFTFWGLFAGFCARSLAIAAACGTEVLVLDPLDEDGGQDMLEDEVFNQTSRTCKAKSLDGLHMAPPCRTFTQAKRSGHHASVKVLRTRENPEGDTAGKQTVEANLLTSGCASLAIQQWESNKYFTHEESCLTHRSKESLARPMRLQRKTQEADSHSYECAIAIRSALVPKCAPRTRTSYCRGRCGRTSASAWSGTLPRQRNTPQGFVNLGPRMGRSGRKPT